MINKWVKGEGNLLFRQGKTEDVFEKYGYVGVILAQYDFMEKKDMIVL